MKKYYVTVNGKKYAVEVEEVKGEFAPFEAAPIVKNNKVEESVAVVEKEEEKTKFEDIQVEEKKEEPADVSTSTGNGEPIECPMPGTILKVSVVPGAKVKKGDVLVVLEAMKMENEIMSPRDCRVVSVNVVKGSVVNAGDVLIVVE